MEAEYYENVAIFTEYSVGFKALRYNDFKD